MRSDLMLALIDELREKKTLSDESFQRLFFERNTNITSYLYQQADEVRHQFYGNKVYLRGLIEISNICKNDCLYCGIRRSNEKAVRYRLTLNDLQLCCQHGYELGFRTFVLQGGEDAFFSDDVLVEWVKTIHHDFPDCAITLSLGERSRSSYQKLYDAGCSRYLLRHETANPRHYNQLHPNNMQLETRLHCLEVLREIGFQTGCGFMVGSPFQSFEDTLQDLRYMATFQPHMVGLGPFIPHKDTPFAHQSAGTLEDTLWYLAVVRLMLPKVLLPATTALATIDAKGREAGLKAGANVLMPNLSPLSVRKKYMLYNDKASLDGEAAENVAALSKWLNTIGYQAVVDRGDALI